MSFAEWISTGLSTLRVGWTWVELFTSPVQPALTYT